jgi:UDP-N-acetylglucosamine diphosphorylase/glucosamine-1-phosphate N-acetyltransferase
MNLIFFDNKYRDGLAPLSFTRPLADFTCGILTIRQKWMKHFGVNASSTITEEYLSVKFPLHTEAENILIAGNIFPNATLIEAIKNLQLDEVLICNDEIIAAKLSKDETQNFSFSKSYSTTKTFTADIKLLTKPHQIFSWNEEEIKHDFELLTNGRISAEISATNRVVAAENIFLEDGAIIEHAIINASKSKMYFAKDSEVMEGSMIRGSFALGEHSMLKLGAKIYGATTIGQHCKVGGEVNNCVIFGYSNKAHDGFMGNSVLGEWCNWGADTNNSNLKNNYEEVKLWSYVKNSFEKTGLQFCGLIMADHSKCGINTMFNTGTVVGVSANIFGAGFPRNIIADFSWGGAQGTTTYQLNKAIETAKKVYERRGLQFDEIEQAIFKHIFEQTEKGRMN